MLASVPEDFWLQADHLSGYDHGHGCESNKPLFPCLGTGLFSGRATDAPKTYFLNKKNAGAPFEVPGAAIWGGVGRKRIQGVTSDAAARPRGSGARQAHRGRVPRAVGQDGPRRQRPRSVRECEAFRKPFLRPGALVRTLRAGLVRLVARARAADAAQLRGLAEADAADADAAA